MELIDVDTELPKDPRKRERKLKKILLMSIYPRELIYGISALQIFMGFGGIFAIAALSSEIFIYPPLVIISLLGRSCLIASGVIGLCSSRNSKMRHVISFMFFCFLDIGFAIIAMTYAGLTFTEFPEKPITRGIVSVGQFMLFILACLEIVFSFLALLACLEVLCQSHFPKKLKLATIA